MPASGVFSIGKDIALDIVTPTGILSLPVTTTSFEAKPQYNKIRKAALDGINRGANIPKGWEGTFQMDRTDATIDEFFAQQEAGYYGGLDTLTATIIETITEIDGSITQFQYQFCCLAFDESGKWEGDKEVSQALSFFASQKVQVA